jgi:hypothetical protein
VTITETLFGGLLAVILLFITGRRLGLSTYWSATLGAALPFLAYLGISAGSWPGGDVLAIHLVVFIATAGVLGVFDSVRQKKVKMHWAPKLIIGFFVLLALINAALLSIATHGLPDVLTQRLMPRQEGVERVHTVFPGVVPHDRNKMYAPHQQRIEEQRKLGWQVEIEGFDQLRSGRPMPVTLRITDKHGRPVAADRVLLGFWRMANSKDDLLLTLEAASPGEFQGELNLEYPGRWIVEIGISRGQDIYQSQRSLQVEE